MHRCTATSRPPATAMLASAKKSNSGGGEESKIDSRLSESRLMAAMSGGKGGSGERDSVLAT